MHREGATRRGWRIGRWLWWGAAALKKHHAPGSGSLLNGAISGMGVCDKGRVAVLRDAVISPHPWHAASRAWLCLSLPCSARPVPRLPLMLTYQHQGISWELWRTIVQLKWQPGCAEWQVTFGNCHKACCITGSQVLAYSVPIGLDP